MLSLVKYFLILQLLFASVVIHAQERIALVIGNADYQSSALDNSVNDAIDIAKTLQDLNFQVTLVTDKNKVQMESAIVEFGGKLNKDTVGLFYYSGHAVQYQGVNYLIPIDSMKQVNNAEDLPDSAIASSSILSKLEDNKNILISAHGNSLRAICKFLFKLGENKISKLEIPTGNPLFITFNDKSEITKCHYLDKERAKDLIAF